MNRSNPVSYGFFVILAALTAGGALLATPATAEEGYGQGMRGGGMHGAGHPGLGMHAKGAHGGTYHGSGGHHGRKGLLGPHWRSTLSEEQRAKLDAIHLAYVKAKAPLKAKAKLLKVELGLLATADSADTKAIDKKIGELLGVKRAKMRAKYDYVVATRAVLTSEQRVSYDMEVMKSAMQDRKGKGKGKGHGGH